MTRSLKTWIPFALGAAIALTLAALLIRLRYQLEESQQTTRLHVLLEEMGEDMSEELEKGQNLTASPAAASRDPHWHAFLLRPDLYRDADGRTPPVPEPSLLRALESRAATPGAFILLGPLNTDLSRNALVLLTRDRRVPDGWSGAWTSIDDLLIEAGSSDLIHQGYRLEFMDTGRAVALYRSDEGALQRPITVAVPFAGTLLELRAAPRDGWFVPLRYLASSFQVLLAVAFWLIRELRHGQTLRYAVKDLREADERRRETNKLYGKALEEVAALESRLQVLSMYDVVTGLGNRTSLIHRLEISLESMRQSSREALCVMTVGFDHIQHISQAFGADFSSRVLVVAAERMEYVLPSKDLLFRVGDFQLAVVLPQTDAVRAEEMARKLIGEVESPIAVDSHTFLLHPSVGIAETRSGYEYAETLLNHAGTALGAVSRDAPARYCFFDSATAKESIGRLQLEVDLEQAFEQDQFVLEYEPFVRPSTHEVAGFEALIRWDHPTEGRLSPDRFVPIAVQTGMSHRLNDWVMRHAARQASTWTRAGYRDFFINFNLSAEAFLRPNLAEEVGAMLAEFGLDGRHLLVELTESTLIEDIRGAARTLQRLAELGVGAWLDDFGTGYSSLSHLRSLPLKGVKIDRSFVERTVIDARDCGFLKALIDLIGYLGMQSIAEGIESREQYELLSLTNCDLYQGYYFSKSMPATQAERWLNEAGRIRRGHSA